MSVTGVCITCHRSWVTGVRRDTANPLTHEYRVAALDPPHAAAAPALALAVLRRPTLHEAVAQVRPTLIPRSNRLYDSSVAPPLPANARPVALMCVARAYIG